MSTISKQITQTDGGEISLANNEGHQLTKLFLYDKLGICYKKQNKLC